MNNSNAMNIKLIVNDEESLYMPLSPDAEFAEPVKMYIRSKLAEEKYDEGICLTVISKNPIDEDRFRAAAKNWIRAEKTSFRIQEKNTIRMLIGTLIFGSVMLLLCLSLEKIIDVLQYSLMPIMGSLALSKSASIIIMDVPLIRAKRWILEGMEKKNVITFEYENDCISDDKN